MKTALVGRDISYTMSPKVHAAISREIGEHISFDVLDIPYDRLESAVTDLINGYDGFFVTVPYKNDIKKYIDCNFGGGVNVVRSRDRAVFNTDGIGFIRALDRNFKNWRTSVSSVLVLGAGGAAYAVISALTQIGKKVYVLNRTLMHALKLCSALGAELYANQDAELVVNCTSVGVNGEDVFKTLCVLPKFDYAYDLVYARGDTPFIRRVRQFGGQAANGLDMLIYQAIEGDSVLLGKKLDTESIFDNVKKAIVKE